MNKAALHSILAPGLFIKQLPAAGIKALSWKEPYATLMLHRKIETRVWDTAYRGWVLICTSKQPYTFEAVNNKISGSHQTNRIFVETLGLDNFADNKMYDYSLGNAIAIGCLTDTWEMRPEDEDSCFVEYKVPWAETVTSKKTGKTREVIKRLYCHKYEDVYAIKPFAWAGKLGFTPLTAEQKNKITLL